MNKKTTLIAAAASLVIILSLTISVFLIKNQTIALDEQVQISESAITIQEKRRTDLIQNLVDTAEQFMKRQNETLTDITSMRRALNSDNIESSRIAIQALTEAYPAIQGESNYKQLMTEMTITENLIADYRNAFNTAARTYNTFIQQFPNSLFLSSREKYPYLSPTKPI